jgi:Cu/Ag efflux protein CusF
MTAVRKIVLGSTCIVALAACAKKVEPPPPPTVASTTTEGDGKIQQTNVITVTATVQAIDYKKRLVTLLGPEGDTLQIAAGPEVRNLDQVKRGDLVVVGYQESIALKLKKPGEAEPGVTEAAVAERAPVGGQPGAGAADSVTVTTKIVKIDKAKKTVTLKGPEGNTAVVNVKDPARLERVKVGDLVEITYTQALAISVEKAPKN